METKIPPNSSIEARVRAATNEILLQKSRRSHWGNEY
ncbi:hypothetical protein T01_7338 [Trichinella spiralis]|uniref:Uncharacterized protein n=1 Tax=Trichinella spiralis TaxID=6334 RepID=A0A0V1AM67_TRISP|nr:hypothetical protein T01_7338 [Trichinella spiralis]